MVTSFSGGGSLSTRREPPTLSKQLISFITCDCRSSALFLLFTKLGANPRRFGDRLVWAVRSNDLTHWATWDPLYTRVTRRVLYHCHDFYWTWLYTRVTRPVLSHCQYFYWTWLYTRVTQRDLYYCQYLYWTLLYTRVTRRVLYHCQYFYWTWLYTRVTWRDLYYSKVEVIANKLYCCHYNLVDC